MTRATGVPIRWAISCLTLGACGGGGTRRTPPAAENPTPSVSGITPNAVTAGTSDTTVTINGSGFIASSAAEWNGSALTTTIISNTKLTAVVPGSQLTGSSIAQIVVVNPTPGGGASG